MSKRNISFARVQKLKEVHIPENGKDVVIFFGGRLPPAKDAEGKIIPENEKAPMKVIAIPLQAADLEFRPSGKEKEKKDASEAALFHEMRRRDTPSFQLTEELSMPGLYGGNFERREKAKYHLFPFGSSLILKTYSLPPYMVRGGLYTAKGMTFGAWRGDKKEEDGVAYDGAIISIDSPTFMELPLGATIMDYMNESNFRYRSLKLEHLYTSEGGYDKDAPRRPFIAQLEPACATTAESLDSQEKGTIIARFADFTPQEGNLYYLDSKEEKHVALLGCTNGKSDDLDICFYQRDLDAVDLTFLNRSRLYQESLDPLQLPSDPKVKDSHLWYQLGANFIPAICGILICTVDPKETYKMQLSQEFETFQGVVKSNTFLIMDVARIAKYAGFKLSSAHARQFYENAQIRSKSYAPGSGFSLTAVNAVNLLTCPQDKAERWLSNANVEFYAVTNNGLQDLDREEFLELPEDDRIRILLGETVNRKHARYANKDKDNKYIIYGAIYAVVNGEKLRMEGATKIPHITEVVRDDILAGIKAFVPPPAPIALIAAPPPSSSSSSSLSAPEPSSAPPASDDPAPHRHKKHKSSSHAPKESE